MEFQKHPASGRGAVRTLRLGARGERLALLATAACVVLAASLWFTVPTVTMRRLRHDGRAANARESERIGREHRAATERSIRLRERALAAGDLLNRIAFLYGVDVHRWPRVLDPDAGLLARRPPDELPVALERFLRGLERGRALLADQEAADPGRPEKSPAILPVGAALYAPAALFGPRVSPWTGAEEFFRGIDLAAPAGSPVVAPGSGTVVFAGRVRPSPAGWLWRLGNLVILSHGDAGATLFGHLGRIEVGRGQSVRRGDGLGTVGSTGWAMSPQLHYEYWRYDGQSLRPTDPLFVILDRRVEPGSLSLGKMLATSAPGPVEPLPGF